MDFSDWITQKYIEWRGNSIGNDRSITEFGKLIKVPQPLLSQWMKKGGGKPTSQKYINLLIDFFGAEVYSVLGLSVPGLSPENSLTFVSAIREISAEYKATGIEEHSPEFDELVKRVFAKYGARVEIEKED